MLYNANGGIIGGVGRRDNGTVDGFQLSDGAIIAPDASMDLNSKIRNNSEFRDRLITAQKQSNDMLRMKNGKDTRKRELLHLALLRNDDDAPDNSVVEGIVRNMEFGAKIQERREKEKL